MADGKLPLSPATPGGQIEDVEALNVPNPTPPPPGPGLIQLVRQRIQIVGRLYNQIAAVLDVDPAANEFGVVTRGVNAAKETTLLARLNTLGQKLMAASAPVVIASDQTSIPVANTPTTSTASTITQVSGTVVLTTLFLANAARRGATLYNDGNTPWFIKLGAGASSIDFTVKLLKDVYYEVPFHYTGIVTGLQSIANGNLYVTELT